MFVCIFHTHICIRPSVHSLLNISIHLNLNDVHTWLGPKAFDAAVVDIFLLGHELSAAASLVEAYSAGGVAAVSS